MLYEYDDKAMDKACSLTNARLIILWKELEWAAREIENIKKSQIKVISKSISGLLEKSKYLATVNIDFTIDMLNESNKTSSEIEAIYFYTGQGWKVEQSGQVCPSTSSDMINENYKYRYFLVPPIKKLHKNSWAQLKFSTGRVVATAFRGEELLSSYKTTGHCTIRLVTDTGNYDYKIWIDVTADEEPF